MPRFSQQFQSAAIVSADYDTETQQLTIRFTSGRSYDYENVPEAVWDGLLTASSPGTYFHTRIKDSF